MLQWPLGNCLLWFPTFSFGSSTLHQYVEQIASCQSFLSCWVEIYNNNSQQLHLFVIKKYSKCVLESQHLTLNDWSRGKQWILFPENLNFSGSKVEGNKIHCSPRDKSLSDLLYSKTNGSNRWKTNDHFNDKWHAKAVKILRVTVNCFLSDVIVFAIFGGEHFHC